MLIFLELKGQLIDQLKIGSQVIITGILRSEVVSKD